MTIWVYSYASHRSGYGVRFEVEVTRKHPLLVQKEWAEEEIQDHPVIIWYKRLDEHDWYSGDLEAQDNDPLAVQKVVDKALENGGEFA